MRYITVVAIVAILIMGVTCIAYKYEAITYRFAMGVIVTCFAATLSSFVAIDRAIRDKPTPHWYDNVHVMD